MNFTLRRGNALLLLIAEQMGETLPLQVSVGRFDVAKTVVPEAEQALKVAIDKKINLIKLYYTIRKAVAEAGSSAGVPGILTELACIEKASQVVKQLASIKSFQPSIEQIEKVQAEAAVPERRIYGGDTQTISLMTKTAVEQYKQEIVRLRREKQKLNDRLLHLNIKTEFQLGDEDVAVLKKYDLL